MSNNFCLDDYNDALLEIIDRPISYHKCFAQITGSVAAGVMLSQLIYWSKRTSDPEKWFYKTQKEWQEETGLTRTEQENARKKLRNLGILEEKKEGVPCLLYFRFNVRIFRACLDILKNAVCGNPANKDASANKDAAKPQTDAINPTDKDAAKPQTVMQQSRRQFSSNLANNLYTEMTTEMTAKMTTEMTTEMKEKDVFSFSQNSQFLENQENAALLENPISEAKQEIEESCAAPPEINAIAITEKKINKTRPKKTKDEDLESKREAFAPFVVVFNQDAPDGWRRKKSLTTKDIKALAPFTKKHGDRSLEIFRKGLLHAHTDKFYRETVKWDLAMYMSNNKPDEFAEEYDLLQSENQTPMGEPSDRQMSDDRKLMETYLRVKAACTKHQQEKAA